MPHATPRVFFGRWFTEARGFTGAENALLISFALAIILLIGGLIRGGSQQAAGDAQRALASSTSAMQEPRGLQSALGGGAAPQVAEFKASLPTASTRAFITNEGRGPDGILLPPGPFNGPPAGTVEIPLAPGPPIPLPLVPNPLLQIAPLPPGQPDVAYDGAVIGANGQAYPQGTPLGAVPPVYPQGQPWNGESVIYVNGILTSKDEQSTSLQNIANATGYSVQGIHNATEGAPKDLAQCITDKLNVGKNPAVDELTDTVYDAVLAGKPIHLLAHSQGGIITSRALDQVQKRLRLEQGYTRAQAQAAMSKITVETFGAAAWTYPAGPKYVIYINRLDPVPDLFGKGPVGRKNPSRDVRVVRFTSFHLNPIANHSFDNVYIPHRDPNLVPPPPGPTPIPVASNIAPVDPRGRLPGTVTLY